MVRHATVGVAASDVELDVDVGRVAILNRSATETVFARADGTDAVVEAEDVYTVPPGSRRTIEVTTDGPTVVSLIATAADVKVEVEG